MVEKLSSKKAVADYLTGLLNGAEIELASDDFLDDQRESTDASLKFAGVESGCELLTLWRVPATRAQVVCSDLVLLNCLNSLPESRLRHVMMQQISFHQ